MIDYFFRDILEEKELIKNSVMMLIATSSSAFVMFLVNLFLSRVFGPESFGNFKIVVYLVGLLSGLIDLGISITLVKYIAEFRVKDRKKIGYMTRWLLKVRMVSFILVLAVLFLFRNKLATYFFHDESLAYLLFPGFFMISVSFFNILPSMVMGYENFKLFSVSIILRSLLYAFLSAILGYFFGVFYALLGIGVSTLVGHLVCSRFLLRKKCFEIKDGRFNVKKIFLRFSLPMHIFNIPNYLGNGIVPFLSLFFSTKLIGYYSFSIMFYVAALIIPKSLGSVLFPKVSRLNGIRRYDDARKSLRRVFVVYTIIAVAGIIGCLSFSRLFVSILAPEYLPGLVLFKTLVCFGFLIGYAVILTSYLGGREKVKEVALVVLIQNVLLFVISFMLLKTM